MIKSLNDTIAAISTARGVGAIAIVRLSGKESVQIADKIFRGKRKLQNLEPARAAFGKIIQRKNDDTVDQVEILDEVIVTKFNAPHSFTGEDIVEINCHGGVYVAQEILNLLLANGARIAEPGEFTKRAFINGKIDLVQAESIADIINAQTRTSLELSVSQLSGELSEKLKSLRNALKKQCMLLEIELDFSEEDLEFAGRDTLLVDLEKLLTEVNSLLDSFQYGRIIREGAHTVLVGRPNVGKSSILNRLLEDDRAIVSDIPGTTRDSLEESLDINGVLFKITDTAGLRETKGQIEKEGVKRTRKLIEDADILVYIFDATLFHKDKSLAEFEELRRKHSDKKILTIMNKIDLVKDVEKFDSKGSLKISAKTGFGFNALQEQLVHLVIGGHNNLENTMIAKVRHRDILRRARDYLENAKKSLSSNLSSEFVAFDLRAALDAIGELTGQVTSEEILDDIFANFCIGK
ncbi:MAG: tRNA uridine-5-carboxymethylaminomethyl(34) synthesis GTPase MnmE [Calditrichaeota bacterium]|nr:tRNA uridine-5-carboxymethylaminomethyl(34) synthesis GTPase MnmE [Calditrichota bacterium]